MVVCFEAMKFQKSQRFQKQRVKTPGIESADAISRDKHTQLAPSRPKISNFSQEHFRLLFDSMLQGVVFQDAAGRIVAANPAARRILGMTRAELSGKTSMELERKTLREDGTLFPGIKHPSMVALQTGRDVHDVVMGVYNLREKGYRWIKVNAVPLFRGKEQKPYQVYTIFDDITERRQAERALQLSEMKFAQAFASNPAAIALTRLDDGVFIDVNATWTALTGFSREEAIGRSARKMNIWPTTEAVTRVVNELRTKGGLRGWEQEFRKKSGEIYTAELSAQLLRVGSEQLVLSILVDITERKRATAALRAVNERLRKIMDIETVGVMFWDLATGVMVDANDTLLKLLGYSREEMNAGALTWQKLTPPEFLEASREELREFSTTGRVGPYEKQYIRNDGTRQWFVFAGSALDEGTIIEFCVDVTARKNAEAALRESEADIRGYFDNVAVGAAQIDATGRWIRVNDRFCKITGYSREELTGGMGPLDLDHPEDRAADQVNLARLVQGKGYETEKRYLAKDGRMVWVHITAAPICDAAGKFRRSAAVINDITESKRIEEALRDASQLNQQIIADAKEGIIVYGRDLKYQVWNRFMEELTGFTAQEVLGCHPLDIFPFLRETGVVEAVAQVLAGKELPDREFPFPRLKSGRSGWVSDSNSALRNGEGEITGVIGIVRDITESKQAEQLLQQANRTLQAIRDCHEAMLRTGTEKDLLAEVCRIIVQIGGERMAWVGYAEKDARKTVHPVASNGMNKQYLANLRVNWSDTLRGRGPVGTAIRTGQTCIVQNTQTNLNFAPWRAGARRYGYGSVIALPLKLDGECFGALAIYAAETDAFDAAEQILLTDLASDLAFGINALRLRKERERLENEVLKSIEREQARIGRELHDGLCQILTGAKFRSSYLAKISHDRLPAAEKEARKLEEILNQAIQQSRDMARGLNSVDVTLMGFASALKKLATEVRAAHGPRCVCKISSRAQITDVHTANRLYRIVQEAVQNARKHAAARSITIQLMRKGRGVELVVQDDGKGIPHRIKKPGLGLDNMRMRASLIGARLDIRRRPEGGTMIKCQLDSSGNKCK